MIALAAIVITHLVMAWLIRWPGISLTEDDAQYLSVAHSLRNFSYREIWDIDAPLHAHYPPGFPLVLAAASLVVGWNFDALLFVVALLSALSILFCFDAIRRVFGVGIALLVSLLFAVNPSTVWDAGILMSEAPFKLFLMISLWAIARERDGTRYNVLAGLAVIAATATRSAGLAFVAGLLVYWLWKRRFLRAAVFGLGATIVVGSWFAWSASAPEPENRRLYVADLTLLGGDTQQATGSPIKRIITAIAEQLPDRTWQMGTRMIPFVLSVPTIPGTRVDNLAWLLVMVVTAAVGAVVLVTRWGGAAAILSAYLSLLWIWTWAILRFLTPVVPLLFLVMLIGVWRISARYGTSVRRGAIGLFAALLFIGALLGVREPLSGRISCDRSAPSRSPGCAPPDQRNFIEVAEWVRDSTPVDAIFLTTKPAAFFVRSGRRSVNELRVLARDSTEFISSLRASGVSYAVVSAVGENYVDLARMLARSCMELALTREFSAHSAVLRLRQEGEPRSDRLACDALEYWKTVQYVDESSPP